MATQSARLLQGRRCSVQSTMTSQLDRLLHAGWTYRSHLRSKSKARTFRVDIISSNINPPMLFLTHRFLFLSLTGESMSPGAIIGVTSGFSDRYGAPLISVGERQGLVQIMAEWCGDATTDNLDISEAHKIEPRHAAAVM